MKKLKPEVRKAQILAAACDLAIDIGYANVRRDNIAKAAGVAMGTVNKYFSTMTQLRGDLMRYAVKNELLPIIAQGLACRDKHALKAPRDLQNRAVEQMLNGEG